MDSQSVASTFESIPPAFDNAPVSTLGATVSLDELRTLRPGQWVSDAIIDACLGICDWGNSIVKSCCVASIDYQNERLSFNWPAGITRVILPCHVINHWVLVAAQVLEGVGLTAVE